MNHACKLGILTFFVLTMASCGSTKPLQYLQGSFDTARLSAYTIPQPVIQQGDLLSIVVYSDNATATAIYNQSVTGAGNNTAGATPGYLVNEQGNINFQGIGSLHIEGLTKTALTELLTEKLKIFLTNPYFNIRFLNYKVTIIGDVARPAVYNIPAEKVNILEALGLAGDLNITARRDNVLIIREQNGKRSLGRINLLKPDIFNNPFYQLQQNDVVYVDLTKAKAIANDQAALRNISIATSIVSTIAIIISVLKR
jgi:polysaccharide biosynthesis/export protein